MSGRSRAIRLGAATLAILMVSASAAYAETGADEETGGIAGQLVDQDGVGVADAEVYADGDDTWYWDYTVTDDNGYFELHGLVPDNYRVYFLAPGAPGQYAFGQPSWGDADLITVVAGQVTTVNDQLLPTGTISGQFTDSDGEGVSASVYAQPADDGSWSWAHTDADGHFSMQVLVGDYRVSFETEDGFEQYAYSTTSWSEAEIFSVGPGETVVVNDQLLTPGVITGRLIDADGDGVEDAAVYAEPDDEGSWGFTWTDEDGEFSLAVAPGQYRVAFNHQGLYQYAFGTMSWSEAEVFTVAAGESITVNDTLITPGSVVGTFTDSSGDGIPDVEVFLEPIDAAGDYRESYTDEDGYFEFPVVASGDYRLSFHDWDHGLLQYAFGAVTRDEADVISVVAGQVTTVHDTLLPTGSVRITAQDTLTGEAVMQFSVQVSGRFGDTDDGEVIITGLPAGTHQIDWASAPGYSLLDPVQFTVVAGEQAEVTLPLHPRSRIETTVVDAATGEPLAGVCLITASATAFRMPEWCPHVSGPDGRVIVEVAGAGTYNLLAWPRDAEGYGAQWVGRDGGTGVQSQAARVTVADGGVADAPVVKMDPAGSVTGVVTDPHGDPVPHGVVRIGNDGFGVGGGLGEAWINENGSYTLDGLGPYEWPLLFNVWTYPSQWSGGVADRRLAEGAPVVANEVSTFDYQLVDGTQVTLTVGDPSWIGSFVLALNARTGDRMGAWWLDPEEETWTRPVLGPQSVKFVVLTGVSDEYIGGDDFDSARSFVVRPRGEQTIVLS
jgi:hypothetical protein